MSDTPRTDERECEAITGLGRCVGVHFARELERESAKLRSDLLRATHEAGDLSGAVNRLREALERIATYDAPDAHAMIGIAREAVRS